MYIEDISNLIELERAIEHECPLLLEIFKSTDGRFELQHFIDLILAHEREEMEEKLLDEFEVGRSEGLDDASDLAYENGYDTGYNDGMKDGRGQLAQSIRNVLDKT